MVKILLKIKFILTILAISGCSTMSKVEPSKHHTDIEMSFFNHLFKNNSATFKNEPKTAYCVGLTDNQGRIRDINKSTLIALNQKQSNHVVNYSECEVKDKVISKSDNSLAILFTISNIQCSSRTDCIIKGGYYEGNLSSQINTYLAKELDGKWEFSVVEFGPVS